MASSSRVRGFGLGLLSFILFSGLVALGLWQLWWMQWQDRLAEQSQIVAASEIATITDIEAGFEYGYDVNILRVRLNGSYRHDLERYVSASRDGVAGFRVITPFIEDLGYIVFVDRGWVNEAGRDPSSRKNARKPEGKISITGVTRLNLISKLSQQFVTVDEENNTWSWYDRTGLAMSMPAGLGETSDGQAGLFSQLYVQLEPGGEPGDGNSPQIEPLEIEPGTMNMIYAAIFFVLAIILATKTVRYFWKKRRKRSQAE